MTKLITLVVSLIPVIREFFTNYFHLESLWGPNEIDWFANDDNHKLPLLDIDAFTIDWNGINGWFVSSVCLVVRVYAI
jgi:hypothetical protein